MRQPQPLNRGRLIRRYKRFLADVAFDVGGEETVHVPNPGAMLGLAEPGMTVWTSLGGSKTRKLPQTLELVETGGGLVCVNTLQPNRLVAEALAAGMIPELSAYQDVRREVRYGDASRVDFLLTSPDRPPCWLEVKGVTLSRRPGLAEWPDCVSTRAVRHLSELRARLAGGERAVVLFIVQRTDCRQFRVAADLDPAFAQALNQSVTEGLEVLAYDCEIGLQAAQIRRPITSAR